jgi:hypothetical protein
MSWYSSFIVKRKLLEIGGLVGRAGMSGMFGSLANKEEEHGTAENISGNGVWQLRLSSNGPGTVGRPDLGGWRRKSVMAVGCKLESNAISE